MAVQLQSNPQLDLAYQYVNETNASIFLTGKAGTGKTTFLHRIKEEVIKRMVVVAPTGVAAINAGGMTIHSFFQLPFGPYVPGNTREVARQRKFSGEKVRLIQSLDLLIIDEISMVRADLLDGIDDVLRRYKHPFKPFGGVQLLMIGDLHQLPPVVKNEDWDLLRPHYDTPYFFSSQALRKTKPVAIELKHIYRQSDSTFIDLLNKVRDNKMDKSVLNTLNSRYRPDIQVDEEDGYITLTTHNATAREINDEKLEEISKPPSVYKATVKGDFPEHAYPTDAELKLKEGAQVMFVKNDPAPEKRFYNGKIGKITRLEGDIIYVRCPGDPEELAVEELTWENVKYSLNKENKEVQEEVAGTFTQFPLKLAWAITIHKSQGLTFERVILDAQAAFAHGQVYVALSRCKSFEGIVLRSKIGSSSVRTDATVKRYTKAAEENAPGPAELERAKVAFQQTLILELFGFDKLKRLFDKMNRILLEHEPKFNPGAMKPFQKLVAEAEEQVFPVVEKFRRQLQRLFYDGGLPEENEELQGRIKKASSWFAQQFKEKLMPAGKAIQIVTDNKEVRKAANKALKNLQKELFAKHACFKATQSGFIPHEYLKVKAKAELDFQSTGHAVSVPPDYSVVPSEIPNPELYAKLQQWRDEQAEAQEISPYMVLPAVSMVELVTFLPRNKSSLKKIIGIGKGRIQQYGEDLLLMIQSYCRTHDVQPNPLPQKRPKKSIKPNSKAVSFEFFKQGKSIEEIAEERGLAASTIEGHLAHFIEEGKLNVLELIDESVVDEIGAFFAANPETNLTEAKEHFQDTYSYRELKMVRAHMKVQVS